MGKVVAYNRQQRRAIEKQKKRQQIKELKEKKQQEITGADQQEAQAFLESLSVPALVAGVNNTLQVLAKKGIRPADYDNKERNLYRLQIVKGKVYFLADIGDLDAEKH